MVLKILPKSCKQALVFIDYANLKASLYKLNRRINLNILFEYLSSEKAIKKVFFYYGSDSNEKSKNFISAIEKIGYEVRTKNVKYILSSQTGQYIKKM